MYNLQTVRKDFPILSEEVNGYPLVYLDNAATSQKPESVIEAMNTYYRTYNANVHRGLHYLSETATIAYEGARKTIASFINAPSEKEVVFTKNTTDGFNHLAYLLTKNILKRGDKVLLSLSEHHSNIVPWQLLSIQFGIEINFLPIDTEGNFDLTHLDQQLSQNVKLVSVQHVSNVTGIIHPIKEIIERAKKYGCLTAIDASQSVPHMPIDVQALDCDFLLFTAHKLLGPTGFGIFYGKQKLLESFEPVWGGGDMISEVQKESSTWNELPWKFEPGTPNISGAIGTKAAIEYINTIGLNNIQSHEQLLTAYTLQQLSTMPHVHIIGPKDATKKVGVIAFTMEGVHPHDIASILDQKGIAIRVGHHCTQILHRTMGIHASARASMYLYNTIEEIDTFIAELQHVIHVFEK